MNEEINYKTNPLHGVGEKYLLIEMVDHYGFDTLFAYLKINCFKANSGIDSSVKFRKKQIGCEKKLKLSICMNLKKRTKKPATYRLGSGKNNGAQRIGRYSDSRNNDSAQKDDCESLNSSSALVDNALNPWAK